MSVQNETNIRTHEKYKACNIICGYAKQLFLNWSTGEQTEHQVCQRATSDPFINLTISYRITSEEFLHGFLQCSAFVMTGSLLTGHQSSEHLLPNADIAEHIASYTSVLRGLCLQSR